MVVRRSEGTFHYGEGSRNHPKYASPPRSRYTLIVDHQPAYPADSSSDDASSSSLQVKETHILQERKIGVWGAISLIVNKIVGAGFVVYPRNDDIVAYSN